MVKRVLVTGAGGFIARPCLAELAGRGYDVHGVARGAPPPDAGVRWHRADLLDPAAADAVLDRVRPTHLLHLAWVTEPGRYQRSAENLLWAGATLGLLESFRRRGGERAVAAGSCAEYDPRHGVCRETTTPLAPASPYGTCKHATQLLLQAFGEVSGVTWAWGRVFFLYGPHEHAGRLVPSVARALLAGEEARCTPGDQVRDYLHVDDVAGAFAALVDSAAAGPFNIASGVPVTIKELVRTVGEACGRPDLVRLGTLPARAGDPPEIVGDPAQLRAATGWRPRFALGEGIANTVRWWADTLGTPERSAPCD